MNHSFRPYTGNTRPGRMLTEAAIIDLNGFDAEFMRECEKIFQINAWLDGLDGRCVRDWVRQAVSDVVELYTLNPGTLSGTLNMGPDYRYFPDLLHERDSEKTRFEARQYDEFEMAYKAFALNVAHHLTRMTEPFINEALALDYSDVAFTVVRYHPGCVVLAIRAIEPMYPTEPFPSERRISSI